MLLRFSIDMINLNLIIKKNIYFGLGENLDIQQFIQQRLFNSFDSSVEIYESNKHSAYRYNLVKKTIEGTVYFGLMHNSKHVKDEIDIKIEYNPNKFKEIPAEIIELCSLSKLVKLKSFDYALDMDIDISKILFYESLKNVNIYKGTYYVGERKNGIKIYNKAKEQNISGDLTRIEYRIPLDANIKSIVDNDIKYNLEKFRFPDIFYLDDINECEDIETILILEGLKVRPELYKKLSRRKKEKIKKATEQLAKIAYSSLHQDMIFRIQQYINNIIIY